MHPRAEYPNEDDEPALFAWTVARDICREIQWDVRGGGGGANHLDMVVLLRNLLFHCARNEQHLDVEMAEATNVARAYRELHYQWMLCEAGADRHPPVLWFPPADRQQNVRGLMSDMNHFIAGWLATNSGMPPSANPDHVVDGRPLSEWYDDMVLVHSIQRRFPLHAEHWYNPFFEIIGLMTGLLWKIMVDQWDDSNWEDNPRRVGGLRRAIRTWGTDEQLWTAFLADEEDQDALKRILRALVDTMERRFPIEQPNPEADAEDPQ